MNKLFKIKERLIRRSTYPETDEFRCPDCIERDDCAFYYMGIHYPCPYYKDCSDVRTPEEMKSEEELEKRKIIKKCLIVIPCVIFILLFMYMFIRHTFGKQVLGIVIIICDVCCFFTCLYFVNRD